MFNRPSIIVAFLVFLAALRAAPVLAADGQIVVTHTKAVNGNVTPNDPPGYPVILSQAGSYILGSNLTPGPGLDAIEVTTSDASIDLNGFKISGGPAGGSNNARNGIWGKGDRLTIRNGTITGFEGHGIHAPLRLYLIVENMRVLNNITAGINNGFGSYALIRNSIAASNGFMGIACGYSCHVEGNIVANNGQRVGDYGVYLFSGTVLGNTIASNRDRGIHVPSNGTVVGYGNNTIFGNNLGGQQVSGNLVRLHPNVCVPACP
jgi:hypothetical protein